MPPTDALLALLRDQHSRAVYLLAVHASLPAALDPRLLHHLRDNYLLNGLPDECLPVTADSELHRRAC